MPQSRPGRAKYTYVHACMLSHFGCGRLRATLWTVAHQAPLSMGFSRQVWQSQIHICACLHVESLRLWPAPCNPMDCSPPGSSVHGILQARILEWVTMPSSRGSSQIRDWILSPPLRCGFLPLTPPGMFKCLIKTQFNWRHPLKMQLVFGYAHRCRTLAYY